jgi:hypothetical protein
MADLNQETSIADDLFPKQVSGLPEAHVTAAVSLADGDVLPLRIGRVKIRLDNSAGADHQMHHPFHTHGAGRFLVLDRGGAPELNLV